MVLPVALATMFVVSLQSPRMVRRIALVGFILSMIFLAYTFIGGVEIKGLRGIAKLVTGDGPLDPAGRENIARHLADRLPAKAP